MRSHRTLFLLLAGAAFLLLASTATADLPAGLAAAVTVVAQAQPQTPPADPPPAEPAPQTPAADTGDAGGMSWIWLVIGAVVLVAIIAILASSRGGSTTVVKETTRSVP